MATKNDKITVGFSIATLEAEAEKAGSGLEPLRVALKDNVIITFNNPQELGVFSLLDFADAGDDADVTDLLQKILSEEDYAALREYNPKGSVLGLLMQKVTDYYGTAAATGDSKS